MTKFCAHALKDADDGSRLILLSSAMDGSWFIRRRRDPRLDPVPMGAFSSAQAAKAWADQLFPGGRWVTEV